MLSFQMWHVATGKGHHIIGCTLCSILRGPAVSVIQFPPYMILQCNQAIKV